MAKKAKVVFTDETYVIVDKTVDEAKALITGTDLVELPVSRKAYNYDLTTINIGDKTQPAYDVVADKVVVNPAVVQRIVETDEDVALVQTGTATV